MKYFHYNTTQHNTTQHNTTQQVIHTGKRNLRRITSELEVHAPLDWRYSDLWTGGTPTSELEVNYKSNYLTISNYYFLTFNYKKQFFLYAATGLLMFGGCKDDSQDNPAPAEECAQTLHETTFYAKIGSNTFQPTAQLVKKSADSCGVSKVHIIANPADTIKNAEQATMANAAMQNIKQVSDKVAFGGAITAREGLTIDAPAGIEVKFYTPANPADTTPSASGDPQTPDEPAAPPVNQDSIDKAAACAAKSHPDSSYTWNAAQKKCEAAYTGAPQPPALTEEQRCAQREENKSTPDSSYTMVGNTCVGSYNNPVCAILNDQLNANTDSINDSRSITATNVENLVGNVSTIYNGKFGIRLAEGIGRALIDTIKAKRRAASDVLFQVASWNDLTWGAILSQKDNQIAILQNIMEKNSMAYQNAARNRDAILLRKQAENCQ